MMLVSLISLTICAACCGANAITFMNARRERFRTTPAVIAFVICAAGVAWNFACVIRHAPTCTPSPAITVDADGTIVGVEEGVAMEERK